MRGRREEMVEGKEEEGKSDQRSLVRTRKSVCPCVYFRWQTHTDRQIDGREAEEAGESGSG